MKSPCSFPSLGPYLHYYHSLPTLADHLLTHHTSTHMSFLRSLLWQWRPGASITSITLALGPLLVLLPFLRIKPPVLFRRLSEPASALPSLISLIIITFFQPLKPISVLWHTSFSSMTFSLLCLVNSFESPITQKEVGPDMTTSHLSCTSRCLSCYHTNYILLVCLCA